LNNNSIGFGNETVDKSKIEDRLKDVFRPEFLNRVDEIVAFNPLTKEQLLQIVDLMLNDTKKVLLDKDISLQVSSSAKNFILEKGTNLKFGARPLRRAIQRYVEDEISEKILRGEITNGQNISIDYVSGEDKLKI
jgi:ATP-dependent Clp protease ATP-binding subunit ClpA